MTNMVIEIMMLKVTFPPSSVGVSNQRRSESNIWPPLWHFVHLFSLPLPLLFIYAAFLPLSSLSMASQWEWECNYAVRRCLQTQKRLNLFQQLAVIPRFNL